jgi:serine/threonine protein kinase
MNPESQVKFLFLQAIEIDDPAEQAAFVQSHTFGSREVENRIFELLRAHRDSEILQSQAPSQGEEKLVGFGDNIVVDLPHPEMHLENSVPIEVDRPLMKHALGAEADRFQKIKLHAKGGLGEVSIAIDRQLQRDVALKEIQAHCESDTSARQRFVFEAEVTGRLEHPGIVPVYALGSYSDGRPFYAMKFVRGDDLQRACHELHGRGPVDYESREFRKLLQRFIDVCSAVSYAHSRGVLHRDIKPANIMLGSFGETLVVDWGLAKTFRNSANQPPESTGNLTSTPQFDNATIVGQTLGTPAYISPEQAAGQIDSMDERTDIYSLGATLYFLLLGKAPFTGTLEDVLERVKKSEFLRPRAIVSRVPKALEAIVMKGMANHPSDRYATVDEMAKDMESYLADEPIIAKSDSWRDRAARFQRKNRSAVQVGFLATFIMALLATAAAVLIQRQSAINRELATREKAAKETAVQLADEKSTLAESESKAKQIAQTRLSQIEKSNDLILSIFRDLDPDMEQDTPIRASLAKRLETAATSLERGEIGDPLKLATMKSILAQSILRLGDPKAAIPLAESARSTFLESASDDPPQALRNRISLANAYIEADRVPDALVELDGIVYRAREIEGADSDLVYEALSATANAYSLSGEGEFALSYYQSALELANRRYGETDARTIGSLLNLGVLNHKQGNLLESYRLIEKATRMHKEFLGANHTRTLKAIQHFQQICLATGRKSQSVELGRELVRATQLKLGYKHPDSFTAIIALADSLCLVNAEPEAVQLLEGAIIQCSAEHGSDSKLTLQLQGQLSYAFYCQRKYDEALTLSRTTLDSMRNVLGPHHRDSIVAGRVLAKIQNAIGQRKAAAVTLQETLEAGRISPGTKAAEVLDAMLDYADTLSEVGSRGEAIVVFRELAELRRVRYGQDDEISYGLLTRIAWNYIGQEKYDEVTPVLAEYLTYRRRTVSRKYLLVNEFQYSGLILNEAKQWNQSEPILREALELHASLNSPAWETQTTRLLLGHSLAMQERKSEAEPLIRESLAELQGIIRGTANRSDQYREYRSKMPDLLRYAIASENAMGNQEYASQLNASLPAWQDWSKGNRPQTPDLPAIPGAPNSSD